MEKIIKQRAPGLEGYYDIEVMRGPIVVRSIRTKNLITNQGLDRFGGAGNAKMSHCHLGVSEIEPLITDIQLGQFVCLSTSRSTTVVKAALPSEVPNRYGVYSAFTYIFDQGVATGSFNEIGVGGLNVSSLFSHSRIIDITTFEPATITVLEQESLRITYYLIQYPPLDDVAFELDLTASQHVCILRAANCGSITDWAPGDEIAGPANTPIVAYTGDLGPITGSPTGTSANSENAAVFGTYTAGTYTRECAATFLTTQGNLTGGIKSLLITSRRSGIAIGGAYQISFDPPIAKDNLSELRMRWNIYWSQSPMVDG
jgi:hypothetical protein